MSSGDTGNLFVNCPFAEEFHINVQETPCQIKDSIPEIALTKFWVTFKFY